MAATSETILPVTTHPLGNSPLSITGEKYKGAGFYGFGDGLHTVEVQITDFIGSWAIQGTLSADPNNNDWVDIVLQLQEEYSVDTTGLITRWVDRRVSYTSANTSAKIYNFIGNFTWIRFTAADWTQGTVNRVSLNY